MISFRTSRQALILMALPVLYLVLMTCALKLRLQSELLYLLLIFVFPWMLVLNTFVACLMYFTRPTTDRIGLPIAVSMLVMLGAFYLAYMVPRMWR